MPQVKRVVSISIIDGHFDLPLGFFVGMYGLICSIYHPRGDINEKKTQFFRQSLISAHSE